MREINEESVSSLLDNKEALAPCDVAAFVYDRYMFDSSTYMFWYPEGSLTYLFNI